jgi:hypothetical protein
MCGDRRRASLRRDRAAGSSGGIERADRRWRIVTTRLAARVAVLAALAATLAGCGTAGGDGGDGAAPGATASLRDQAVPVYRDFVRCVREHGYPDFPDPVVREDGSAELPPAAEEALERLEATLRPACEHILRRLPAALAEDKGDGSAGQASPAQIAERKRFARCVREHGAPNFPDPDATGAIVLTDPDGRTTFDRATVTAFEACGLRMSGGDIKRRLDDLGVR